MNIYKKSGFTLIELLIVIALLGALAIGLIGALDPFEQLKKGTDTGVRNSVSEVQSAVVRYYALKGHMPWVESDGSTPITGVDLAQMSTTGYALSELTGAGEVLDNIVQTGELKSNFTTLQSSQLTKIKIFGDTQNVTACFNPESKSFRSDVNSKYNSNGLDDSSNTGCPKNDTSCFWCVQ